MNNDNSLIPVTPEPLVIKPLPLDAPEWAHILNENVGVIASTMNLTMATIDTIATEVQPMVDSLTKSPILKMFGGK